MDNFKKQILKELSLSQILSNGEENAEKEAFVTHVKLQKAHPFDAECCIGDIRLFSQTEKITYAAVVRKLADGTFLTVPYSHCSVPADNREMLSENRDTVYMQTLQIWNSFAAEPQLLAETWKIGSLSPEEQSRIARFYDAVLTGKELPEDLQVLTSESVMEDDELLGLYFRSEIENFRNVRIRNREFSEIRDRRILFETVSGPLRFSGSEQLPYTAAFAAGEEKENPQTVCRIEEFPDTTVMLEYSLAEETLFVQFFDKAGNLEQHRFAGWKIVDSAGKLLAVVKDGTAVSGKLPAFDGACCLIDTEDNVYAFGKTED